MTKYFCNYCEQEITEDNGIKPISSYMKEKGAYASEEVSISLQAQIIRDSGRGDILSWQDICLPCVYKVLEHSIRKHAPQLCQPST